MQKISINTKQREELVDITTEVAEVVKKADIEKGICLVYSPHTTCAVTINENADPDVREDIIKGLSQIISICSSFKHIEGNSDAHLKTSLVGNSTIIPIYKNCLLLGRWQGIYLCEFDGPRNREVFVDIY